MDSGGSNGWLFAFSAVMALAFVALIYFLFVVHPPEAQQASSVPGQASGAPATRRLGVAAPPELAADETVLCGYGRVKQSEAGQIQQEASQAADKTLDSLKARLSHSKNPREAALGLYMSGSTDALVALASASGDPQVYALAFLSCNYNSVGTCALLSAQQWANIEPDNGIPWLLVASAAGRDKDARNQAVIRASAAKTFDPRLPDFLGMVQLPEIRTQAPQTRSSLADQLTGMQMALPMISYAPFIQFCGESSSAYGDPSTCRKLASLLLENRTMLGFSTGVRLAELAGWGPDEVKALREKRTEYQSALTAVVSRNRDKVSSDCGDLAAFDRWAADYSSLGDRGVAEKYIAENRTSAVPAQAH